MTPYMLFAGLGILIYAGVTLAEAAVSGLSSAQITFGLQFAFFASLSLLLATDIVLQRECPPAEAVPR